MTKSPFSVPAAALSTREPRAFAHLAPLLVTAEPQALDVGGRAFLAAKTGDHVAALVRGLVDHTIALQNRRALESGNRQPMQISVLNRRRRCARAWIQSIVSGDVDRATLHSVANHWLPTLAGNVADRRSMLRQVVSCFEYVRGALSGLIFDAPAENLLGHARALHVLETVLGVHLSAVQAVLRG